MHCGNYSREKKRWPAKRRKNRPPVNLKRTVKYVRKHWYEVVTASDGTMKLYFERQPRGGRGGARWWLFSIREPEEGPTTNT
jgi:hypothetical protein